MKRNTLFTVVMAVLMISSLAGGMVTASQNAEFEGESVNEHHEVNATVVDFGDRMNHSVLMTEEHDLAAGETVSFDTFPAEEVGPYEEAITDVEIVTGGADLSASISFGVVEVTNDGAETQTLQELKITFDTAYYPYVLESENAIPYDNESTFPYIEIYNQTSDGERVQLRWTEADTDFFAVIHEVGDDGEPITEDDDGEFTYLGASAEMESAIYDPLNIVLDEPVTNDTEVVAQLYASDDGEIGEPLTDGDGNTYTDTAVISAHEDGKVMDAKTLVESPTGNEVHTYQVYDADEVVDVEITADNGVLNETTGAYEPNDTGEEVQFTVNVTRNDTVYQDLPLHSYDVKLGLDTLAFSDIEDTTDTSTDTVVLKSVEDEGDLKVYTFDVVNPNAAEETYTVSVTGTVESIDTEEAVEVTAVHEPEGGLASETSTSFSLSAAGGTLHFTQFGDFGLVELGIGVAVVGLTVGGLWVYRDRTGQMSFKGYGAYTGSWKNPRNIVWVVGLGSGLWFIAEYFTGMDYVSSYIVESGLPEWTPVVLGGAIIVVALGTLAKNSKAVMG